MKVIVCKSRLLATELALFTGVEETLVFSSDENQASDLSQWLSVCLRKNIISLVVYEPLFFVDPSPFRLISPLTQFIVLSSPGDEQNTQTALVCGACAVIDKPLVEDDVRGVLSLVTQ